MRYPVAVWNTNGVYSAEVPDLPGAITEADSIEELERSVKEASSLWMECVLDENKSIPAPTSIESHTNKPEYQDCLWLLVDFPLNDISDKAERINITIPSRVLRRLDNLAKNAGESRSGYITSLVMSASR